MEMGVVVEAGWQVGDLTLGIIVARRLVDEAVVLFRLVSEVVIFSSNNNVFLAFTSGVIVADLGTSKSSSLVSSAILERNIGNFFKEFVVVFCFVLFFVMYGEFCNLKLKLLNRLGSIYN